MSVAESVVVGRKTPADGKLEVSSAFAEALGGDGSAIQVRVASGELPGTVVMLACTCSKAGTSGKHEHHFVLCDAFRELPVGAELRLSADSARLDVVRG